MQVCPQGERVLVMSSSVLPQFYFSVDIRRVKLHPNSTTLIFVSLVVWILSWDMVCIAEPVDLRACPCQSAVPTPSHTRPWVAEQLLLLVTHWPAACHSILNALLPNHFKRNSFFPLCFNSLYSIKNAAQIALFSWNSVRSTSQHFM